MYRDPKQWSYVRRLILEKGESRKGVSRKTGISRKTIRKMLRNPRPPFVGLGLASADETLLRAAQFLAAERLSIDLSVYRRRELSLWGRARDLILKADRHQGAVLLRDIADLINGITPALEGKALPGMTPPGRDDARTRAVADRDWMDRLLRGTVRRAEILGLGGPEGAALLLPRVDTGPLRQRKKAVAVLAHRRGVPIRAIAGHLSISRASARKYIRAFAEGGREGLFAKHKTASGRRAEDEHVRRAVFGLLHEPPSAYGINRTSWRMADLTTLLRDKGTPVCAQIIREITRSAGWRWRKARRVLTSNDPEYRQKVDHIKCILANLKDSEAFFSIDEFGPFAIRARGGTTFVGPDKTPTVPQRQSSKGSLIMTAALELSKNQITHFYSSRKDTNEMIRMLFQLIREYRQKTRIYLSWDAASWHASKAFHNCVSEHNDRIIKGEAAGPTVAVAPLPASAQFLNVIESVFSGMARAIIANSDYGSVEEARRAIDRYVSERNEKFRLTPKRAGGFIWGSEREPSRFSVSNNCKDPLYYR